MLGYLPEALVRYQIDGTWLPFGVEALRSIRSSELIGVLFSIGYRGWISWTPIVMPALFGLLLLSRRGSQPATRWLACSGLVAIAGMFLLDVMHPFGAGAAFGGRRYVSVTPLLALGLATLFSPAAGQRLRTTAWVLLPALGAWNLCVMFAYELLTLRHGIYPTLLQTVRYALGGGIS